MGKHAVTIRAIDFKGRPGWSGQRRRNPFTVSGAIEQEVEKLAVGDGVEILAVIDKMGDPVSVSRVRMNLGQIADELGRYFATSTKDTDFLRVIRLS